MGHHSYLVFDFSVLAVSPQVQILRNPQKKMFPEQPQCKKQHSWDREDPEYPEPSRYNTIAFSSVKVEEGSAEDRLLKISQSREMVLV